MEVVEAIDGSGQANMILTNIKQEGSQGMLALRRLLLTHTMYNFDLGYVQVSGCCNAMCAPVSST